MGGRILDAESELLRAQSTLVPEDLATPTALDPRHIERGYELTTGTGLDQGSKLALVIDRDAAFRGSEHSLRNTRPQDLDVMIQALLDHGYIVFRMGSLRRNRVHCESPHFFDYAFWCGRFPDLDVFLAGVADICVSFNTGLAHLPGLFGVPTALLTPGIPNSSLPLDSLTFGLQVSRRGSRALLTIEGLYAETGVLEHDLIDANHYEQEPLDYYTCVGIIRLTERFGNKSLPREILELLQQSWKKSVSLKPDLAVSAAGRARHMYFQPRIFLPFDFPDSVMDG